MAKDLLSRYIWLVDTIHRTGGLSFDELNAQWRRSRLYAGKDIPFRTFYHQRSEIEELFGVRIVCSKGTGYKYRIEDDAAMRQKDFSGWLLNTFTVSNVLSESARIRDRIVLDEAPSAQQFLTEALSAMQHNFAVKMTYSPFTSDHVLELTVYPYFVKMHERRWYLYGRTDKEATVKVYGFDRITNLEVTRKHFRLPADFSADTHLYHSVGVIKDDTKPCRILIRANGHHPRYLKALPLHHSQEEVEKHRGYSVFSYYLSPTSDFYEKLLAQGEYVEVLSPPEVCGKMKAIVHNLNKRYAKK
ncbi:MAG: WYL domain-containing protein [Bacteroidales bacterium]|jgi:hypothetical protein|nr:WYL domain-containing protein [Bacteroidales bacterium]